MNKKNNIYKLVVTSLLIAIVVVLQTISNNFKVGPFSITLALIPIVIGGVLFGPKVGAILGLAFGITTLFDPAALTLMEVNPFYVFVLQLSKGILAGVIPSLIYIAIKKASPVVGTIVASLSAPIINTGVFVLLYTLFFKSIIIADVNFTDGMSVLLYVVLSVISLNFLIEISVSAILTPAVIALCKIIKDKIDNKRIHREEA